jgi:2,3-bisphosphoglycerate-independent phosphoglycerate mutase
MFVCEGKICEIKPSVYLEDLYNQNLGKDSLDEHIVPSVVKNGDAIGAPVLKHDAILFWNFRSDRARQVCQKIIEKKDGMNLVFSTMTEYDPMYTQNHGVNVAFPKMEIKTTIAKEISIAGLSQAHIAETEKFPHATCFLNGGVEKPYEGEKHIMLESRKDVPTHDFAPKMRAEAIADKAIEEIELGTNFIFINFANPDMVGHTANVPAIIEAVEETDLQLGRVIEVLEKNGGVAFVTADHGNAEVNIDPVTGDKHTSHTINPVPSIFTDKNFTLDSGTLADIAPTILTYLDIEVPREMTGRSILE